MGGNGHIGHRSTPVSYLWGTAAAGPVDHDGGVKIDFSHTRRRFISGEQEPEVAITYLVLAVVLHAAGLVNTPVLPATLAAWWPLVLLAGVGCILLRRRAPLPCALGMAAAGSVLLAMGSIGGYFLIFETVFTIFLLCPPRTRNVTGTLLATFTVLAAAAQWASDAGASAVVLTVFTIGFVLFTPMLWAQNVRTAKELAASQAERARQATAAARQREQLLRTEHAAAVEAERTSLAREMHDVLSARFSSMALLSAAALNRVPASSQDPAWQAIRRPVGEMRREALAGLEEMTRMVRMLHAGAPQALRATLDSANALIEAHRAGGRTIDYTGGVDPSQVGAAAQTAAYRTISELLVNHSRHAPHTALRLVVRAHGGQLRITAANPLPGPDNTPDPAADAAFTPPLVPHGGSGPGAGSGLRNISARAQALGGQSQWQIDQGQFTVHVTLPLQPGPGGGTDNQEVS